MSIPYDYRELFSTPEVPRAPTQQCSTVRYALCPDGVRVAAKRAPFAELRPLPDGRLVIVGKKDAHQKANILVLCRGALAGAETRSVGKMNIVIAGKYQLEKKIGSGAFGDIYLCTSLEDGKHVAIKIEKMSTRHPQLLYESRVVKQLFGAPGLPTVLHSGVHGESNIMVMDLLGPSLEELLGICNKQMSLKTVLMLADQMLCRLHYIHSKNYIHRDVKPENFLIGMGKKSSILHVVDFGLAKQYRNPKTHRHIPYKDGKSLTGTARYASLNTHLGIEQSRRDDVEGLMYMVIYLLKGSLPWQGIQATTKDEKYRKIMQKKMSTPVASLCMGLPEEIAFLVDYARNLTFDQKPDYSMLRRTVKSLFLKQGFEYDYIYDWTDSSFYAAMVARRALPEAERRPALHSDRQPTPRGKLMTTDARESSCLVF